MSEAMGAIGEAFEAESGVPVTFSFAGTGTLARQIEAGAPADVFVSADTLWMGYLTDRGDCSDGKRNGYRFEPDNSWLARWTAPHWICPRTQLLRGWATDGWQLPTRILFLQGAMARPG
jgi:hypothetical protein